MDFGKLDFLGCLGNGMRNLGHIAETKRGMAFGFQSPWTKIQILKDLGLVFFLPQNNSEGLELNNFFGGHKPFASLWMFLKNHVGLFYDEFCVTALGPNHHHLV